MNAVTKTEPRPAFIGKTELAYLDAALDKAQQPLHPNFIKAAAASTLKCRRRIQGLLQEHGAHTSNPKQLAVAVARGLTDDIQAYVLFWTGLMSDVAFQAHMDCLMLERQGTLPRPAVFASLDAMYETRASEPFDNPVFDVGDDRPDAPPEDPIGEREPIAATLNDAYEAVGDIQSWIETAFSAFDEGQLAYWQVIPVPLCKRGADEDYVAVVDFDEYRDLQNERWQTKNRSAGNKTGTEQALALMTEC